MRTYYLYSIIRDDSEEYIGITTNINKRIWQHKNGYGSTNLKNREFSLKILAIGNESYISKLEQLFIEKYKPSLNKIVGGKFGSGLKGESNGNSSLTELEVYNIRLEYADGKKQVELAEKYSVSRQAIGYIVTGKTWNHVPGPLTFKIKRVDTKTRENIKTLYLEGSTIEQISNQLNIKWATVYSYVSGIYQ